MENKFILDACCGGRMFWFDKAHPNTLYVDIRKAEKGHIQCGYNPNHAVTPDEIADFRNLPYANSAFRLVVFDPPHIVRKIPSINSVMFKKYGTLTENTWKIDLKKGFDECWRVLADYGVLIFKWGEDSVRIKEVLNLLEKQPLFGHPNKAAGTTHWLCFMKIPKAKP